MNFQNTLSLGEIIEKVRTTKVSKKKIEILRQHDSKPLRMVCKMNFDPDIKFLLPNGEPPYQDPRFPAGMSQKHLFHELKKFYLYIEGGHPKLNQPRREQLFIQLLESLGDQERQVVLQLKSKKLKGITKEVVEHAFPGMLESDEFRKECINGEHQ